METYFAKQLNVYIVNIKPYYRKRAPKLTTKYKTKPTVLQKRASKIFLTKFQATRTRH